MHSSTSGRGSPDAFTRPLGDTTRSLALVSLSLVAAGLWFARAWLVGPRFSFLWWNLFLAWVPWGLALVLPFTRRLFWPVFCVWLAFFPNAPYLLTDLVHLKQRVGVPLWFDVLFLSAFAWAGCTVGWDSLSRVHFELQRRVGAFRAALLVSAVVLATGLGVFLGRFERLNSWEVVTDPLQVALTTSAVLLEPRALLYSLAFAGFVGAGYLFTRPVRAAS